MCPCGGTIRPINKDYAQCDKCKDDTYPISDEAAGGEYGNPDQVAALKFQNQQLGDEVERLLSLVNLPRDEHLANEYEAQLARLASWRKAGIAMRAAYAGHHPGSWPDALRLYADALKIDSAEALNGSCRAETEPLSG